MDVIWDPAKARANLKKHGVSFSDAALALYDPKALTVEDETAIGERRWISVGLDATGRVVVIVYAQRNDKIRLVSARSATKMERRRYESRV